MKVAITTSSFGKYDSCVLDVLEEKEIRYVLNPYGRKLNQKEVVDVAKGAEGIIAGTESLDEWAFDRLPGLKVISRCGVGMDNVDLAATEKRGITVFNTPFGPTLPVAELTVGLILDLLRKVTLMDRELRAGTWKKRMGSLLHGKRIGIVGFGRIGQKVAELLLPFGVEINYCDVCDIHCLLSCSPKEMADLFSWADIITLHVSSTSQNILSIGPDLIAQMKKGAWLVNVARGGVVDEEALYIALKENRIAGAALDVFEDEPYTGALAELDNVILTPHIGSYALEGRVAIEAAAVENLLRGFDLI
jgi:D-3-phosphoglycerate dehydrogenase / 2-oxoglutarate reductase